MRRLLAAKHAGRTTHAELCCLGLLEQYRELAGTPGDAVGWGVLRADVQGHVGLVRVLLGMRRELGLSAAAVADRGLAWGKTWMGAKTETQSRGIRG